MQRLQHWSSVRTECMTGVFQCAASQSCQGRVQALTGFFQCASPEASPLPICKQVKGKFATKEQSIKERSAIGADLIDDGWCSNLDS